MSWNGSQIIYDKVVRPVFLRHEAMVDNIVSDLGGKAMSAAENLTREGTDQFNISTLWLHSSVNHSWTNVPSLSSVLTTLMKNKALVTQVQQVNQPEPKSLPSTSAETSAARVAPSEPGEDRPVCSKPSVSSFMLS